MFNKFVVVCLLLGSLGGGLLPSAGLAAPRSLALENSPPPRNLNEITVEQLDELPGIGPALAERIVVYREQNGPFERVEQLNEIKGIGDKTLEKLQPYLTLE